MPDEREHVALRDLVDSVFPVGPRARGAICDSYIGNLDIARYPFESITVPALVIAAEDDTLAPYEDSRAMAERIRGARFVSVQRGGHALTQLDPRARLALTEFLADAKANSPIESSAVPQAAPP